MHLDQDSPCLSSSSYDRDATGARERPFRSLVPLPAVSIIGGTARRHPAQKTCYTLSRRGLELTAPFQLPVSLTPSAGLDTALAGNNLNYNVLSGDCFSEGVRLRGGAVRGRRRRVRRARKGRGRSGARRSQRHSRRICSGRLGGRAAHPSAAGM